MSSKNNIRNILVSLLSVILFDGIYTVLGFLIPLNIPIKIVSIIIAIALLCGLFYVAYMIGAKIFSAAKINALTIIIVPMILLAMIFGLSLISIPIFMTIIQYPVIILTEAFSLTIEEINPVLLYGSVFLQNLMCLIALFGGSCKNKISE